MKFFHIADVHLGAKNNLLSQEKQSYIKTEQLELLRSLFEKANATDAKFILICGDLFHNKSVSIKLQKNFFEIVEKSAIPVFYVRGNHDEKFEREIFPANFIILDEQNPCVTIGGVDIWCAVDDKIIRKNFDQNKKNILLIHGNVENVSDNDFVDIKGYFDISFDYVAMGHIHSFQASYYFGKPFVYSGSLFSNGFDECGNKGYVEVEIEDKTNFKFNPLATTRYMICECDITNLSSPDEIARALKTALTAQCVSKNDVVRAVLTGYFDEDLDKNLSVIKNYFDDYFYFEIVDKSRLKIDIENIKKESLSFKAEFIRLVEESSLSEDEKSSICLAGIEALKGEELSI